MDGAINQGFVGCLRMNNLQLHNYLILGSIGNKKGTIG